LAPTTTTTTTTLAPTTTTTTTVEPNTFNVTANGSSNYVINGSSNPTLSIIEGQAYTFNINAVGHPFWIKTVSSTGTGNAYSSGVTNNGTDNGTITFVVPYDAPSTLYYNCQYHSGMAGTINVTDVPTTTTTTAAPSFTTYNIGQDYANNIQSCTSFAMDFHTEVYAAESLPGIVTRFYTDTALTVGFVGSSDFYAWALAPESTTPFVNGQVSSLGNVSNITGCAGI
jgi:plastocyanin